MRAGVDEEPQAGGQQAPVLVHKSTKEVPKFGPLYVKFKKSITSSEAVEGLDRLIGEVDAWRVSTAKTFPLVVTQTTFVDFFSTVQQAKEVAGTYSMMMRLNMRSERDYVPKQKFVDSRKSSRSHQGNRQKSGGKSPFVFKLAPSQRSVEQVFKGAEDSAVTMSIDQLKAFATSVGVAAAKELRSLDGRQ